MGKVNRFMELQVGLGSLPTYRNQCDPGGVDGTLMKGFSNYASSFAVNRLGFRPDQMDHVANKAERLSAGGRLNVSPALSQRVP